MVMKVYLLVLPLFMRGGIQFSDMGRESTFLMYGLVALGGAWAVSKSGNLLTSLVNEAAGRQEQEAMRGAMGMMMMAASPVINGVRSAAGQATGKMGLTSKQIAGKMGSAAGRSGAKGYQKAKSAGSSAKNKLRKGKLELKAIAKHSGQRMMENKKISSAVNWGAKQGQKVKKAAAWTNQQRHRAADWGNSFAICPRRVDRQRLSHRLHSPVPCLLLIAWRQRRERPHSCLLHHDFINEHEFYNIYYSRYTESNPR